MFQLLLIFLTTLAYTVRSQLADSASSTVCPAGAGCIRGRLMRGYNIPLFEAFMGIPYALPPEKNLRFSNPQEYPKWTGTYDAFDIKPDCIQKNYLLPSYPVSGSEDCLYLNVYRPVNSTGSNKLPVMIYIYGGGWFSGTANPLITGPEYIMDTKKVILVTFSYRLGAFGFLSTGDAVMPGNFGLKDQLLAIKWVQKNIEAFGGDPAKVTLFGQSVGAVSAHMHMLSSQSKGLFQGVIALSGTANVPFGINDNPLQQTIRVAELCGIKNAQNLTSENLMLALRSVNYLDLINAGDGLKFWSVDPVSNYRPVVEPANSKDPFFTTHPEEILKTGSYQPVPFLLGTLHQEGAVRALAITESPDLRNSFNKNFFQILKKFLEFPAYFSDEQLNGKVNKIIQEYFKGEQKLNNNTAQAFLDLVTERGFHHALYNTLKYYVNTVDTNAYPIYLQSFNYTGPFSFSTLYTGGSSTANYGVVHCDELIYLFRSRLLFPDFPKHSPQAKAVELFVKNVVHFAKYQKPRFSSPFKRCNRRTFDRQPETICDYKVFGNNNLNGSRIIIKTDNKFNVRRMKFWDEILNSSN